MGALDSDELRIRDKQFFDAIQMARTGGMQCYEALRLLKAAYGQTEYDRTLKADTNSKIDAPEKREKRKHYPPSYKQRFYDRQGGDCPWCTKRLDLPARRNDIDHIDPNADPWECPANHQALHHLCNLEKGSMSLEEQAKHLGRTIAQIISRWTPESED